MSDKEEPGPSGENSTISISEYLAEFDEMERDYETVLAGSDDKFCTYSKVRKLPYDSCGIYKFRNTTAILIRIYIQGYIKRQALFACLSCTPEARTDAKKRAGICLACSYSCHIGHDLIELHTKRTFRCDCGTAKILAVRCRLDENKLDQNDRNLYNQNFSGLYCVCHRPYPDPDDSIGDEMSQCVICEDWYHSRHLDNKEPDIDEVIEMICSACMTLHPFLHSYSQFMAKSYAETSNENITVDDTADESAASDLTVIEKNLTNPENVNNKGDKPLETAQNNPVYSENDFDVVDSEPSAKRKHYEDAEVVPICKKPIAPTVITSGATFWSPEWRLNLCTCDECMNMMKIGRVEFLVDPEDTMDAYEQKGLSKPRNTEYNRHIRALASLDRVHQINIITAVNTLKEKLGEFFNGFVQSGEEMTAESVRNFFQKLKDERESQNDGDDSAGGGAMF